MTSFDTAFDRLIGHEGSYTWHPNDPGGETNWGISKHSYPNLDIKWLTRAQAKAIYLRDFWNLGHMDELPGPLAFQCFDAAVNHGIQTSIRFLQRAAGVADDGFIGPVTLQAIANTPLPDLLARFIAERLDFYTGLSGWSTFGKGWTRRAAQNLRYAAKDTV